MHINIGILLIYQNKNTYTQKLYISREKYDIGIKERILFALKSSSCKHMLRSPINYWDRNNVPSSSFLFAP